MNRYGSLAVLLLVTLLCAISGRAQDLKLLISVQQPNIVAPNPVRATLHFHNSGQQTLWLYRPVQSKQPNQQDYALPPGIGIQSPAQVQHYGGSTLGVHLEATTPSAKGKDEATGQGFALVPDALPFPRLVRLAPGADYEERVSIHVKPAQTKSGSGNQAVWGHYKFSVSYSADYSNGEALARDINANLWHGKVSSNSVMLNLQPATAQGSIAGTVLDSIGRPYSGALVTLSDNNENALDQVYSDDEGKFSFTGLPLGRYWLSVREPGSDRDTSVFRNVDVSPAGSPTTAEIMLLPVEANKADRFLHKPVLFHVVDNKGHSLAKVKLAILLATGNIIENLKAETGEDGFTAISLIPGSNLVTLRMHGCKNIQRRADVAPGPGVDGFKYEFDCTRK